MRDVLEKYIELNKSFPNKAGKLRSLIEAQKRLLETLSKSKQNQDTQSLMLAVSQSYDVTIDLLEYMRNTLQGVANDAEALMPGAKVRNALKFTQEENQVLWNHYMKG